MLEVQVDIEVVTPMFSAVSDPTGGPAEFRIPELKAAMRFWWRAFQPDMPVADLKEKESQVFGLTENSGFRIIPRAPLPFEQPATPFTSAQPGVRYLWYFCLRIANRQGVVSQKGRSAWIKPGNTAELSFRFKDSSQARQALTALWLAEQFGSLGYRARKAAGCFRIIRIDGQPNDIPTFLCNREIPQIDLPFFLHAHYLAGLREVFTTYGSPRRTLPEYTSMTSFPGCTHFLVSWQTYNSWESVVNYLGEAYKDYRDHNQGPVNPALAADLHYFADTGILPAGRTNIEKATLGLPILFRFTGAPKVYCEQETMNNNRRASPLFFHVGKAGAQGPWWANLSLLWSEFLPSGVRIRLSGEAGSATVNPPPDASYALSFLRDLQNGGTMRRLLRGEI